MTWEPTVPASERCRESTCHRAGIEKAVALIIIITLPPEAVVTDSLTTAPNPSVIFKGILLPDQLPQLKAPE